MNAAGSTVNLPRADASAARRMVRFRPAMMRQLPYPESETDLRPQLCAVEHAPCPPCKEILPEEA